MDTQQEVLNQTASSWEIPLLHTKEVFQEKAFCIISDEIKAKIHALGLTEEDIAGISLENNNHKYLELIDVYFSQVLKLQSIIKKEVLRKHKGYEENMSAEEFERDINYETKNGLMAKLSYKNWLKELFKRYDGKWQEIVCKRYFRIFTYLLSYSSDWDWYQFDWDLAVWFFELSEKIERNRRGWSERFDLFDGICDAYERLYKETKNPKLFNDLLKLCLSTWEKECVSLLKTLKNFDISDDLQLLKKHYWELIKLWILAWENSPIIFTYPSSRFWFLDGKNKDLIMAWFEKLWSDFLYVKNSDSWFIQNVLERFPERFVEFCENLKKLADFSGDKQGFYLQSLDCITQFIVDYPDKWDFLLKICEIFEDISPQILSTWKNFIYKFIKYFPDNYEEILLKIKNKFYDITVMSFLPVTLNFLRNFPDFWEEKILWVLSDVDRLCNTKLDNHQSTQRIFFRDWLDFAWKYITHFPENWPEVWEKIIKIINKHFNPKNKREDNEFFSTFMRWFERFIHSEIVNKNPKILDELLNFLEKVWWSRDSLKIISSLKEDFTRPQNINQNELKQVHTKLKRAKRLETQAWESISYTLAYLLKYKKSRIIPFIQDLNLIKELNLWIDVNSVLFGWISLEYRSNEELQKLFTGPGVEDTEIWKAFIKVWGQNHQKSEDMRTWIYFVIPKNGKPFDALKVLPTLMKIQNVFAESILWYFEKTIRRKMHIKFRKEFQLSKDFNDSLLNQDLLEFYKIYSSTRINKKQAFELLQKYLCGEVYSWEWIISELYPYNRPENTDFLNTTFKNTANIWLSRNEKVFEIKNSDNVNESENDNGILEERIAHHLKVANDKIRLLGVKHDDGNEVQFESYWELAEYFHTKLKKEKDLYDTDLFADLDLQVCAMKELVKSAESKTSQSKKISKIKIYHELEPLKIAMMGNWVDGSCLSYYSPVGNYWSAITNALEINKWVFYIEDAFENIIARVLVWVDSEWNLEVHPMYFKWNPWVNLWEIFQEYIKEYSERLWVGIDGSRYDVEVLFCEEWYNGD